VASTTVDAQEREYERQLSELVKHEDYLGAAALQKQRNVQLEALQAKSKAESESARIGENPSRTKLRGYEAEMKVLLLHGDTSAAVALFKRQQEELEDQQKEEDDADAADGVESETEDSAEEEKQAELSKETHVLKMLYKGNVAAVSREDEQLKKARIVNAKHTFYKNTRCTSRAQEDQSALPAGVINRYEDSSDDDEYSGEQLEIAKEMQELRRVQHLVNQKGWDAAGEGRATSPSTGHDIDLRLDWDHVKTQLAKGGDVSSSEVAVEHINEEIVLKDWALDDLDPTQRVFADRVLRWGVEVARAYNDVRSTGTNRKVPKLRSWLGGSAGCGKSRTLKTIVQHLRLHFQKEHVDATVQLTAYTGVAAFNIGFGAMTSCSCFHVFPNVDWKNELSGEALRKLEQRWQNVELLIVDEISFIGRAFFARMHLRTQQARRRLCPNATSFGDMSIILVGDFGQLEPIDDWSICDTESGYRTSPKKRGLRMWQHARLGAKLLQEEFTEAVMLSQVHRSKEDRWWTESCLRLRDFTCTKEGDYDVWREHDLDRGHLNAEQKKYFEEKAVWLCARCEDVGSRNGRKMAQVAEAGNILVHQIHAEHSNKKARKQSSKAFDGLRPVLNLVRGCKVMLSRNVAYRYGLANGTRGTLVGVVYGPGGVGTLPEALIVDVPEYCGPAFYPEEPKWVPLLPMFSLKEGTRMSRTQFPVVAGFAITVNKAQGLTIKEGVVIHLQGSQRFRPASKHGLPFVAWTRSESFALTAFKNIPPWHDFVKGRESDMLRMRLEFNSQLQEMHHRTMAEHSELTTPELEAQAQAHWSEAQTRKPKKAKQQEATTLCAACLAKGW